MRCESDSARRRGAGGPSGWRRRSAGGFQQDSPAALWGLVSTLGHVGHLCFQRIFQPDFVSDVSSSCSQAVDGPVSQIRKSAVAPALPVLQSVASGPTYQRRINTCKAELQQLVQQKREQCSAERIARQMMDSAEWESRPPPPGNTHARTACLLVYPSFSCQCVKAADLGVFPLTTINVVFQGGTLKGCWSLTSMNTKLP